MCKFVEVKNVKIHSVITDVVEFECYILSVFYVKFITSLTILFYESTYI